MPTASANGLTLEYDSFGERSAPPLVLVMGFSLQMIAWDERFCRMLAARGFHVVRFDNRDVGLSTHLDDLGVPDIMRAMAGDRSVAAYTVEDMAADLVGLLDALDLPSAHVVGVSMGGFIAQAAAIAHPSRLRSMTSIMSSTGDRSVGHGRPEVLAALMGAPPASRDEAMERSATMWRLIGSPGFPFD